MQLKSFSSRSQPTPRGGVIVRRHDGLYITETQDGGLETTPFPVEARAFASPQKAQQFIAENRKHPLVAGQWTSLVSLSSVIKQKFSYENI